jgi:hypothetical protein
LNRLFGSWRALGPGILTRTRSVVKRRQKNLAINFIIEHDRIMIYVIADQHVSMLYMTFLANDNAS